MKNYKLYAIVIFGIVLGVISCSKDFLDQPNPNAVTPDTFWRNEDDATKAIIGAYSPLTHIWNYTRFEIFLSDYRDDVVNAFGTSERTAIGVFNGISLTNGTFWVWSTNYQGITRANEIIFNVPNIEDISSDAKNNILGEAYFLRAFNYFNLVNNWLNVPLITLPFGEIEDPAAITQAPPEDVWQQIISDLKEAQNLLPDSWDDRNMGRVFKASADALLGKVYLYRQEWGNAKSEFEKVMNNPNVGLMENYGHNFTEDFENNKESLFEIQLVADGNGGWGGDRLGVGKGSAFHPDIAPAGFTGQDGMRINQWVLDLFLDERTVNDEIDPRTYTTLFFDSADSTNYAGEVLKSQTYGGKSYQEVFPDGVNVWGNKHLDTKQGYESSQANGWHQAGNNLRMLRYADVLLMYAEAEFNMNGSSSAALEAINEVRARVDMAPFESITMQDIEDERVKELSLERTRYFDILRWGKVVEYIVNRPEVKSEAGGTGSYQPGREYIDIPQNEIDANPNIKHNPGY